MMKLFTSVFLALFLFVSFVFIFSMSIKCDHLEMRKVFSFQPQNSTAAGSLKMYCKECDRNIGENTRFRGTPDDLSYLEVVKAHTDGEELVGGEFYTVTAVVSVADYEFHETKIRCKVESDDIVVGFSVKFLDEFEESVGLLKAGDEVTFRGRFYDEGCGWTECELITE